MSERMRQVHRWLSMLFMSSVIITSVALAMKTTATWVSYLPLPWLFALMLTGLYLFVLPYASKWRSRYGAVSAGT
jgi:hypothetical protein